MAAAVCILGAPAAFAADPDPAVVADAGRVCQKQFGGKLETAALEPPALVVITDEGKEAWRFLGVLPPAAAGAPKTVFCVRSRDEKAGTYDDHLTAYNLHWTVTALSWPDGRVRQKSTHLGLAPAVKTSSFGGRGSISLSELETMLDVRGAELLGSFNGSVFLSPDRRSLAVAVGETLDKYAAQILEWPSRTPRRRVGRHWPIGFLPDGRLMTRGKKTVDTWDIVSGKSAGELPLSDLALKQFSRDGSRAMLWSSGTEFWDLPAGRQVSKIAAADAHLWLATSAMSADGHQACGAAGGKPVLWNTTENRATKAFDAKELAVELYRGVKCAVSGDAQWMVVDVKTGLHKLSVKDGSVERISEPLSFDSCLAVSGDGRWLALGRPGQLELRDLKEGKMRLRRPTAIEKGCRITFSVDDALLWHEDNMGSQPKTFLWDAKLLTAAAAAAKP